MAKKLIKLDNDIFYVNNQESCAFSTLANAETKTVELYTRKAVTTDRDNYGTTHIALVISCVYNAQTTPNVYMLATHERGLSYSRIVGQNSGNGTITNITVDSSDVNKIQLSVAPYTLGYVIELF